MHSNSLKLKLGFIQIFLFAKMWPPATIHATVSIHFAFMCKCSSRMWERSWDEPLWHWYGCIYLELGTWRSTFLHTVSRHLTAVEKFLYIAVLTHAWRCKLGPVLDCFWNKVFCFKTSLGVSFLTMIKSCFCRSLIKDEILITRQEVDKRNSAICCWANQCVSVSTIKVWFDKLEIFSIAENQTPQAKALNSHCVNGLAAAVTEAQCFAVPAYFKPLNLGAVVGNRVQHGVNVNFLMNFLAAAGSHPSN